VLRSMVHYLDFGDYLVAFSIRVFIICQRNNLQVAQQPARKYEYSMRLMSESDRCTSGKPEIPPGCLQGCCNGLG